MTKYAEFCSARLEHGTKTVSDNAKMDSKYNSNSNTAKLSVIEKGG